MLESKVASPYIRIINCIRPSQGDILRNINLLIGDSDKPEDEGVVIANRYAVVMTQECDLDRDFISRDNFDGAKPGANDKFLRTILICPAFPLPLFIKGEHLENWKMQDFNTTPEKVAAKLKKFELDRFHLLEANTDYGVIDLVIDFKHFYTAPRELIYRGYPDGYIATINELFRERLSQRFAGYLSRIGLPDFAGSVSE